MRYETKTYVYPTWNSSFRLDFYVDVAPPVGDPDCKCSYCHEELNEDDSPLLLWEDGGKYMAVICKKCSPSIMKLLYSL